MTVQIRKALAHVQIHHPEITMVVFNKFGQWCYMTDNFDKPDFGAEIDQSILEDAADSVEQLPAVFHQ